MGEPHLESSSACTRGRTSTSSKHSIGELGRCQRGIRPEAYASKHLTSSRSHPRIAPLGWSPGTTGLPVPESERRMRAPRQSLSESVLIACGFGSKYFGGTVFAAFMELLAQSLLKSPSVSTNLTRREPAVHHGLQSSSRSLSDVPTRAPPCLIVHKSEAQKPDSTCPAGIPGHEENGSHNRGCPANLHRRTSRRNL